MSNGRVSAADGTPFPEPLSRAPLIAPETTDASGDIGDARHGGI